MPLTRCRSRFPVARRSSPWRRSRWPRLPVCLRFTTTRGGTSPTAGRWPSTAASRKSDPFSHTALGRPFPNHQWLGERALYLPFAIGGLPLVTAVLRVPADDGVGALLAALAGACAGPSARAVGMRCRLHAGVVHQTPGLHRRPAPDGGDVARAQAAGAGASGRMAVGQPARRGASGSAGDWDVCGRERDLRAARPDRTSAVPGGQRCADARHAAGHSLLAGDPTVPAAIAGQPPA